jgi:hypothetical protein
VVVSVGESICDQYNITSRNVKEFLDGGLLEPLLEESTESFIIYGQSTPEGKLQIGILAALDVEDCRNNIIKRHELCTLDGNSTGNNGTSATSSALSSPCATPKISGAPSLMNPSGSSPGGNAVSTRMKQYQSLYVDPIMIMYRQNQVIDDIVTKVISTIEPIELVSSTDSAKHYLWPVKEKVVSYLPQRMYPHYLFHFWLF